MIAKTVLVTGAAGLLGAEVASRLAAEGHSVLALLHDNPVLVRNNGRRIPLAEQVTPGAVAGIRGDVTVPGLGLGIDPADRGAATVDVVVHAAAVTDFGRTEQVYERVNVRGTANVVEFVRRGTVPTALVYVSTAYVCGELAGEAGEEQCSGAAPFGTPYEASKFRAERLVRTSGVPFAVVRPSIVVGAERTGVVREFQNMYVAIKALTDGRVRAIPGHYDALLDLAPIDHVADVVAAVASRFDEIEGATLHAIGHQPHSLRDFSDVLAEYPSFHVPRYIPPASFDVDDLPAAQRVYYDRIVGLYASFFRRRTTFSDTVTTRFLGRRPTTSAKPFLRRLLNYGLKVGYLGNPLPAVDEVLAGLSATGPGRANGARS